MPILAFFFLLLHTSLLSAAEPADCSSILVENAEGASIVISAAGEKAELEIDQLIGKGDSIATGKDAWVDLRLCDGSGLRVGERSKTTFEEALSRNEGGLVAWAFDLLKGSLLATIQGDEKSEQVKMRIRTPSAAVGVRGTEFLVDAEDGGDTVVHTMEGEVLLGKRDDYEALARPGFAKFQERFEAIRKERMSRIAKGEERPRKASEFKPGEFQERRQNFFRQRLERVEPSKIRERLQKARERIQEKRERRQDRPSAQIPAERREKVQQRFQERKQNLEGRREQIREKVQQRPQQRLQQMPQQRLQQRPQQRPQQQPQRQGGKRNR